MPGFRTHAQLLKFGVLASHLDPHELGIHIALVVGVGVSVVCCGCLIVDVGCLIVVVVVALIVDVGCLIVVVVVALIVDVGCLIVVVVVALLVVVVQDPPHQTAAAPHEFESA